MGADNPAVEHITEDDGDQDSTTTQAPDTRTDEEILAEGNKDEEIAETVTESEKVKEPSSDTDVDVIVPEVDDKPKEDEKEEETDESKDEEEELEEEFLSDEEQEIEDVVRKETPEYNDIKKKYPKFFKEFPGMRHTLFRMKAIDRIFPTVEEARSVAEKHDDLIQLEAAVLGGESDKVIRGLKNISPDAMEKFAEQVLPALFAEARPVHDRITSNVLSAALRTAQRQARSSGNKNLYNAVGHISQFLFGKDVPPEATRKESSPEIEAQKKALDDREQQMYDNQAKGFQADVLSTSERLLRKALTKGLDPNNALPDFVKESIVNAAVDRIGQAMDKDEAHLKVINDLWARAQKTGFSKEAKSKLIAAWIGRAKPLVGPTRRKLVQSAIEKQEGKTSNKEVHRRKHIRTGGKGKPDAEGFRPKSAKDVDWTKTSDLDILEGKATQRKR
jgi:hypothetical protein